MPLLSALVGVMSVCRFWCQHPQRTGLSLARIVSFTKVPSLGHPINAPEMPVVSQEIQRFLSGVALDKGSRAGCLSNLSLVD